MDSAAFVDLQTRHRLGHCAEFTPSLSEAARAYSMQASSSGTLAWNASEGLPYPVNGWTGRVGEPQKLRSSAPGVKDYKFRATLMSMLDAGLDFDAVIDMQDARVRALAASAQEIFPVVSFNRVMGAPGRVLWHMPGPLHQIGSAQFLGPFPDPDALPFSQRAPKLVWRGSITGRAGGTDRPQDDTYRFQKVFALVEKGKYDIAWAADRLDQFPRYHFVRRMASRPMADVGFVDQPGLHPLSNPLMQPLRRPAMGQLEQARNKYIAVLRGADLASSFFWTMNSGSLGLVMDCPWESFASVHFRPWEHYVPFKRDLSDLDERLDWCNVHPDDCAAMVQAAGEVCKMLAREDIRKEIDRCVVDGLRSWLVRDS
jgi:hypothetical protein